MRTGRMLYFLVAVCFFCTTPAVAFIQPDERLADPASEMRAEKLGNIIVCPVCDGQVINSSNADIARAMRQTVRAQIAENQSDDQILRWFRERYGASSIAAPRLTVATALLWGVPGVMVVAGGFLLTLLFRQQKK
jgi:cytochrome c-type biogenesis protein CcmH